MNMWTMSFATCSIFMFLFLTWIGYVLVPSYILVFHLVVFLKFHVITRKYGQTQKYFCAFGM
jgi:O-antigen ligase